MTESDEVRSRVHAGRWVSALGRQRQANLCEFEASLVYRVSSRTASIGTGKPCLGKTKTKKETNKRAGSLPTHYPTRLTTADEELPSSQPFSANAMPCSARTGSVVFCRMSG